MANKIRYTIEASYDRHGNYKKLSDDWVNKKYFIKLLVIGAGAKLLMEDTDGRYLHTSTVEDISMWENGITITTRNTVYRLKPEVISDEEN
jgi:hypothetical protein